MRLQRRRSSLCAHSHEKCPHRHPAVCRCAIWCLGRRPVLFSSPRHLCDTCAVCAKHSERAGSADAVAPHRRFVCGRAPVLRHRRRAHARDADHVRRFDASVAAPQTSALKKKQKNQCMCAHLAGDAATVGGETTACARIIDGQKKSKGKRKPLKLHRCSAPRLPLAACIADVLREGTGCMIARLWHPSTLRGEGRGKGPHATYTWEPYQRKRHSIASYWP